MRAGSISGGSAEGLVDADARPAPWTLDASLVRQTWSEYTTSHVIWSTLRLRPYQVEAQNAVVAARERGAKSQLVSLATGLGKSVVIATLPEVLELRATDVTLVIAHRDELIQQLVEKMRAQNPDRVVGIEKAEDRASGDCTIVVATVQTLTGKRLTEFITRFGRRIALFIIDEAHHAAAPTYRAIIDKLKYRRPDVMIFGFTATPTRGDGAKLTDLFSEIVYTMDARAAIDAGYLVPVRSYAVSTQTSLDDVATRGGDFVLGALAEAVDNEERNALVIDAYQRLVPTSKALVFTASVEHARHVAQMFRDAGVKAAFASGETPTAERETIVADFRGDRVDVLVNCGLYLEGFDVPNIEVIINARPTKSTTLYTQITGRGLRPLDEFAFVLSNLPSPEARREVIAQSAKPYAIVLDVVDQARKHQIVTLPFLWGLPSQIDAEGRPISQVAEHYEDLCRRSPRDAARVRTAEQIETALIELDEAADSATQAAAWQPISIDHWRLDRPPHKVARDRRGRSVPHFTQQFDRLTAMAKQIAPNEDAAGFALRLLNVDRRSVREESVQVDVAPRETQYAAVAISSSGTVREIAVTDKFVEAIAAAEAWLQTGASFEVSRNGAASRRRASKNGAAKKYRFRRRRRRNGDASVRAG